MSMTFRVVFLGSLLIFGAVAIMAVFVPQETWQHEPTILARQYSPLQARGRYIYYSNGCNYCHTQYVRELDNHYGPKSEAGDYKYERPMLLGSERTGPDLSQIGRKRSEAWEYRHFIDPRRYSPGSIMPSFVFLSREDLSALTAYLFTLGDRVAQERMIPAQEEYAGKRDPQSAQWPAEAMSAGWASWTAMNMQAGKELYMANCATCHGCSGNGLGHYAGTQVVTPANFKQEPFRNMPDDQWYWHVSEGVNGTVMPVWKLKLTPEETWNVIRYIQQTFARPVMREPNEGDPPPGLAATRNPTVVTAEALDEAKLTYTRECLICHGVAGRGDGPYATHLQPPPADLSGGPTNPQIKNWNDGQYFWRLRDGIPWSAMPPWKIDYSDEELWRLVHYVRIFFTQNEPRPHDEAYQLDSQLRAQEMAPISSFEDGKNLFAVNCARCHGMAGRGDGYQGVNLQPKPTPLAMVGRMRRGDMPVYKNPYKPTDQTVLKTGEDHYNLFCSPCHGDYARGSYLAPRLADKRWYYGGGTDDEVFNIVSRGLPGQLMPAHNVLDEKTRWAVIAYVRSRGGLPNPMALPQARQREVELVK